MSAERPFRAAWAQRRWRRLLIAFAVSTTGDFIATIAIVIYLVERTGSASWVAAVAIARLVVMTVGGPIGGALADNYDRRRLMVTLDVIRAFVMMGLSVVAVADGPPLVMVLLSALSMAATTPFRPAAVAATPRLVDQDSLTAANAAEASVAQLAWFVGPAAGSAVVAISSTSVALVVNAMTFLVSAALLSGIGDLGGGRHAAAGISDPAASVEADARVDVAASAETSVESEIGILAGIVAGASAIRRIPGLLALSMFLMATLFAFGIEQVVHVLVAQHRLGMGAKGVGVLAACIGAGGLIVAPFSSRLGRGTKSGALIVLTGIGMGAPLASLAIITRPTIAFGVLLIEGAATLGFEVLYITLLQRACPDELLGRVYALQDSAGAFARLLGSLAIPVLIAVASLETSLWVGGGVLVGAAVLLFPALQRLSNRLETDRLNVAPIVEHLRASGLFADAGEASLERLARASTRFASAAGECLIRQGNASDAMYLVTSGEVVVTSTDESGTLTSEVDRLSSGAWFGEVGLIRSVPCTATVTTATSCELLRVDGPTFVSVLTQPDAFPDPLQRSITVGLARTHPSLLDDETPSAAL
jgi:CRP-like cAMP-binding protein/predicted MFS family arabinose efflux permease